MAEEKKMVFDAQVFEEDRGGMVTLTLAEDGSFVVRDCYGEISVDPQTAFELARRIVLLEKDRLRDRARKLDEIG
jgi:hypothetical protein